MTYDFDDPQGMLDVLRPALVALVTGQQAQTVEVPAGPNGQTRRVTYHAGDIQALRDEIAKYEGRLPQTGKRPRRYAIRVG